MNDYIRKTIFAVYVGDWIMQKYRARASESGTYVVARQLRKQGIPLEIARLILLKG